MKKKKNKPPSDRWLQRCKGRLSTSGGALEAYRVDGSIVTLRAAQVPGWQFFWWIFAEPLGNGEMEREEKNKTSRILGR